MAKGITATIIKDPVNGTTGFTIHIPDEYLDQITDDQMAMLESVEPGPGGIRHMAALVSMVNEQIERKKRG